jgi:DNA-binding response OmpR family regulator
MDQDIAVVIAGDLSNFLPSSWELEEDIVTIHCSPDAEDISKTVERLNNCNYILLLPATAQGMQACTLLRKNNRRIPIVLVGESGDRETLLYSAQMGCLDFISKEDDIGLIKKRLQVYLKLYSLAKTLRAAEQKIKGP